MRPTTRSTPVRRQGQPQTEIRSCENPRMRVCSPTSQGFAPTVARSSYQQLLARLWRGRVVAPPSLTKDIRGWAKAPAHNADVTKALAWRRAHVSGESVNTGLTRGHGARAVDRECGSVWAGAPLPTPSVTGQVQSIPLRKKSRSPALASVRGRRSAGGAGRHLMGFVKDRSSQSTGAWSKATWVGTV
jgi:hypothetical protein